MTTRAVEQSGPRHQRVEGVRQGGEGLYDLRRALGECGDPPGVCGRSTTGHRSPERALPALQGGGGHIQGQGREGQRPDGHMADQLYHLPDLQGAHLREVLNGLSG